MEDSNGSVHDLPMLAGPVPPSRALPFFAFVRAMRESCVAGFDRDVYRKPIVEIRHWRVHTFVVNDPAAIRRVLIDNAGNYLRGSVGLRVRPTFVKGFEDCSSKSWPASRRLISSSLDPRAVLSGSPALSDAVNRTLDRWRGLPSGAVLDLFEEMRGLTGEIIARIAFSSDSVDHEWVDEVTRLISHEPTFSAFDFIPFFDRLLRRLRRLRHRRTSEGLADAIDRVIEKRRLPGTLPRHDLLACLTERGGDPASRTGSAADDIHTQLLTVLGAGLDSAAAALAWAWYLLSLHPAHEERLHAELDSVLAGRLPVAADLPDLPFTRMVVDESLRLYPPVPMLPWRGALADDELCGATIPKGATISIVPWVLHRHELLWSRPGQFDPERFASLSGREPLRFAYLPFGAGPRACLAASFALSEIALVLAALAQHFRLRLVPGHSVEVQAQTLLKARHGIKVSLEPRSAACISISRN